MPQHRLLETDGVSPKAIAAGGAGLSIGVAIAVLNAVMDANLLGGWPMPLQVILLAAIPPVITYLSAFGAAPGTVREARRPDGPA